MGVAFEPGGPNGIANRQHAETPQFPPFCRHRRRTRSGSKSVAGRRLPDLDEVFALKHPRFSLLLIPAIFDLLQKMARPRAFQFALSEVFTTLPSAIGRVAGSLGTLNLEAQTFRRTVKRAFVSTNAM